MTELVVKLVEMIRLKKNYLKYLLLTYYYINHIIGMAPCYYDLKAELFQTNKYFLIYPIFMSFLTIFVYCLCTFRSVEKLQPFIKLNVFYFHILVIVVMFGCQCLNYKRIVKYLNNLQLFFRQIKLQTLINSNGEKIPSTLFVISGVCIVSALLNIIASCGAMFHSGQYDKRSLPLKFAQVMFIVHLYFCETAILNTYFALNWMIQLHYGKINDNIAKVMVEAECLMQKTHLNISEHSRMIKFCELSDKLDALAALHDKLTDVLMESNGIVAVQLLIGIAFYFSTFLTVVSIFS